MLFHEGVRIYVAGHNGLIGSAVVRCLRREGCSNLYFRSRGDLDLRVSADVADVFAEVRPEVVLMCAGTVGSGEGGEENVFAENLAMGTSVIEAADRVGVERLVYVGCADVQVPRGQTPAREAEVVGGAAWRIAEGECGAQMACLKLGMALREQYGNPFVGILSSRVYGPGHRYRARGSQLIPGLMWKMLSAKRLGKAFIDCREMTGGRREWLYVDDLALACCSALRGDVRHGVMNVAGGTLHSLSEIASVMAEVIGYRGEIRMGDVERPKDRGRLLNTQRIRSLGWLPRTSLRKGLEKTFEAFSERIDRVAFMEHDGRGPGVSFKDPPESRSRRRW
jgi:GDP-L-fucose synthase